MWDAMPYLKIYNHNIPQRALKHKTPIQALKEWHNQKPELFVKRVYNQAGLDTYWTCRKHINSTNFKFRTLVSPFITILSIPFFSQQTQPHNARNNKNQYRIPETDS
jgi:broad specificity polyphosphatase/5'/3'-nucleotidase SurE